MYRLTISSNSLLCKHSIHYIIFIQFLAQGILASPERYH